jgi:hypothetical protein
MSILSNEVSVAEPVREAARSLHLNEIRTSR